MNYRILESKKINSLQVFIDFWSKQYYYPKNEVLYTNNINKSQFDLEDIYELYKWKNGMNLSGKKKESLELKITSKIDVINNLKNKRSSIIIEFLEEFAEVSFVWKIFLLHIIQPYNYPIYDQHIHRAFNYVNGVDNEDKDVSQNDFYFKNYLKFIENNEVNDLKKLDEAFFAFGQFLNINFYRTLID